MAAREPCRKHSISDGMFYIRRSKYGGMKVSEAKQLKALKAENAKLKKMMAEQMLNVATFKEMLGSKASEVRCEATNSGLDYDREELQSAESLLLGRALDNIALMRGYPCMVVSDNGTVLTWNTIL